MFLYKKWISLPLNTRDAIANKFGIVRKGGISVTNNQVTDDGYPIGEVERVLCLSEVKDYVGIDTTDGMYIDILVDKITGNYKEPEIVAEVTSDVTDEVKTEVAPTEEVQKIIKRGRPKK